MAEQLVTVTKLKEVISGNDMRTDSGLPDSLNETVAGLLDGAIARSQDNGRQTVRPEDLAGRRSDDAVSLTVASRIKDHVKSAGLRSDANLPDAVNGRVQAILEEAIERARANGRSTVRPYDLPAVR